MLNKFSNWKKKHPYLFWFFIILMEIIIFALIAIPISEQINHALSSKNQNYFWDFWVLINIINWLIIIFIILIFNKVSNKSEIRRVNQNEYGSSDWLVNEKNQTRGRKLIKFEEKYPINQLGWVVKTELKNNKKIFYTSDTKSSIHHALVIGITESGKTQKTVLPAIINNSSLTNDNKPSMVILDVKGELLQNTKNELEDNGYEIKIFNLRNTFKSDSWNPLFLATKYWIEAMFLQKQLNSSDDNYSLNLANIQTSFSKAEEIVTDIASVLYPVNSKDPFWDESARKGFLALYYLSVEFLWDKRLNDYDNINDIDAKDLQYAIELINLPSIAQASADFNGIRNYFINLEHFAKEKQMELKARKSFIYGQSVLNSSEKTSQAIFSVLSKGLDQYKLEIIKNVTCKNEINLSNLSHKNNKPTALFIVVPDEKETTYLFASLLVDQIIKSNIEEATKLGGKCERQIQFYLDEFGNLPTLPRFDTTITAIRSRNMCFMLIIQSMDQIYKKYGNDGGKIIIENCKLHIYIATTDEKTNEYYSKRLGHYTAYKTSFSNSSNDKSNGNNSSLSTNIEKMSLMSVDDLLNNPKDMMIILKVGNEPAYVKTLYFYQIQKYLAPSLKNIDDIKNDINIINWDEYYFNLIDKINWLIIEQAQLKLKKQNEPNFISFFGLPLPNNPDNKEEEKYSGLKDPFKQED